MFLQKQTNKNIDDGLAKGHFNVCFPFVSCLFCPCVPPVPLSNEVNIFNLLVVVFWDFFKKKKSVSNCSEGCACVSVSQSISE